MPSVLDRVKSETGGPRKVYKKLVTENIDPERQGVANPRNTKQVKNVQSKTRAESRLGRDDIYNLVLLANHLDGFVKHITVYPDLVAIFSLPEILQQFNQLLEVKSYEQIFLSYDTTFNLGDCYVSAVVFKNVLFKESPFNLWLLLFTIGNLALFMTHFFDFLRRHALN